MPDICIVSYSRTGNTQTVAEDLAAGFDDCATVRIVPRTERSYPNWLARSFLPGSTVAVRSAETDLRGYDAVFFGTPKWTFSCPPVTAYLARAKLTDVTTGLFVTYGGFDERRYTRRLADRLRALGATVPATLRVQRDCLGTDDYDAGLARFRSLVAASAGLEGA